MDTNIQAILDWVKKDVDLALSLADWSESEVRWAKREEEWVCLMIEHGAASAVPPASAAQLNIQLNIQLANNAAQRAREAAQKARDNLRQIKEGLRRGIPLVKLSQHNIEIQDAVKIAKTAKESTQSAVEIVKNVCSTICK